MDVSNLVTEERKKIKNKSSAAATISKELDIMISMTMGSDKGVLMVTAKSGRKEVGAKVIHYVADPNYRREIVDETEA